MAPEKNCWGARAVKVPTVSGVQESLQAMPIVLPPKKSKKGPGFYEVPTMHGNLRADGGVAKILGVYSPQAPAGAIPGFNRVKYHVQLTGFRKT